MVWDELLRWLSENCVDIASLIVGIIIAVYLYILEKRRDEHQNQQTEQFNKWMAEQAKRQTAMIEALTKSLPNAQAEELSKKVAELLPDSIQIGEIIIQQTNIRIAQSFLGGGTYVEAVAFGEDGERLRAEFGKLQAGQIVKYISPDYKGVAEIKEKITIDETETVSGRAYVFHIWLQIKG